MEKRLSEAFPEIVRAAEPSDDAHQRSVTPEFTDFSLEGDTAILYYTNHHTMLKDGTPVDQVFANIHVFIRERNDWKLLASMSRLEGPKAK